MAFLLSPQITIAAALGSIVLSKCSGWALYKIAATYTVAMVGCGAVGSLAGFYFGMRAVKKDPSAGIVAAFWTLIPSGIAIYKLAFYWGTLLSVHNLITYGIPHLKSFGQFLSK